MMTTCLFCNEPAKSREHIFPAVFGGRRCNRGIYCEVHNKAFGAHVKVLLDALGSINARLEVRPDGDDKARPVEITTEDGERFHVLGNRVTIAPPPHLTPDQVGRPVDLIFASQADIQRWRRRQEKKGARFESTVIGKMGLRYFARPVKLSIEINGDPFFRAVAYLALTHLAHYFPEIARGAGMQSLRNIVASEPAGDRIWWESLERLEQLPSNPFRYGHTVAIGIDGASGQVSAIVAFFGVFIFGLRLGTVAFGETRRVTVHINPLEERRQNDVIEDHEDGKSLELGEHADSARNRASLLDPNTGPVFRLIASIEEDLLARDMRQLLAQLTETWAAAGDRGTAAIRPIMDGQRQRILNLMRTVNEDFVHQLNNPSVTTLLGLLTAADPNTPCGLTAAAQEVLDIACGMMTDEIADRLASDTLTEDGLRLLFGGGPGGALLFEHISMPVIFDALGGAEDYS